ncbi:hypothetical protein BD626DRAFT_488446 [Schizophyllum amplum]|uniref:Uncharacterized protein n=1 Tax=Schizophyllum amplum TaxID=97359 RepID=A0A550CKR1_9AGAR|nr:hypothetical protein BD626DRAFT_488446 [Auriculariopsis ampla]
MWSFHLTPRHAPDTPTVPKRVHVQSTDTSGSIAASCPTPKRALKKCGRLFIEAWKVLTRSRLQRNTGRFSFVPPGFEIVTSMSTHHALPPTAAPLPQHDFSEQALTQARAHRPGYQRLTSHASSSVASTTYRTLSPRRSASDGTHQPRAPAVERSAPPSQSARAHPTNQARPLASQTRLSSSHARREAYVYVPGPHVMRAPSRRRPPSGSRAAASRAAYLQPAERRSSTSSVRQRRTRSCNKRITADRCSGTYVLVDFVN